MNYARGKVLGGSSSINAMIYMQGQKNDYDHWESLETKVGVGMMFCLYSRNRRIISMEQTIFMVAAVNYALKKGG